VLVSSHLMSELEDTTGHLVVVGRSNVIADTSFHDLLARASSERVELRTSAREAAMRVLAGAGAEVMPSGADMVTIRGLPAERGVALLGRRDVPFPEVAAHRATLEEAYMELTHDAVEFRSEPVHREAR
jgi:ABC-2 type transport system ATP-binding protein